VRRRLTDKGSTHVGKDCSRLLEHIEPRASGDMRRHDDVGKRREATARLPRLEAMHVEPASEIVAAARASNSASSSCAYRKPKSAVDRLPSGR
jgi:hypothetical protein